MKHNLSSTWHKILTKLAEYPDGIDRSAFCTLMGDGRYSSVRIALDQMFFSEYDYYLHAPMGNNRISISDEGIEAINEK